MELKKWLRLTVMLPLIIFLVFTNIYQDPANLYHDFSVEIAEALLEGKEAFFYSKNGDERGVKQHLIEHMPEYVDCITVGPSLTMEIRSDMVGTDNYYNLSASGLNFNDYMAEFALLEANNVKVDRVVLCVDSYFFDEIYANGSLKTEWMPYANYMIIKLGGGNPEVPPKNPGFFSAENLKKIWTRVSQAVSITYFQSSCKLIRDNRRFIQPARWGIIDEDTKDHAYYEPDGSTVFSLEYRSSTVDDVIKDANSYDIEKQFGYGKHVDSYYFEYFDRLVKYLTENNIEVEFFLCPLCPTLWDRLGIGEDSCEYYLLDEIEEHAREIADKYRIKVTGSYNPYAVGASDSDYWDCRHMRMDSMNKYFDFKE